MFKTERGEIIYIVQDKEKREINLDCCGQRKKADKFCLLKAERGEIFYIDEDRKKRERNVNCSRKRKGDTSCVFNC